MRSIKKILSSVVVVMAISTSLFCQSVKFRRGYILEKSTKYGCNKIQVQDETGKFYSIYVFEQDEKIYGYNGGDDELIEILFDELIDIATVKEY